MQNSLKNEQDSVHTSSFHLKYLLDIFPEDDVMIHFKVKWFNCESAPLAIRNGSK